MHARLPIGLNIRSFQRTDGWGTSVQGEETLDVSAIVGERPSIVAALVRSKSAEGIDCMRGV